MVIATLTGHFLDQISPNSTFDFRKYWGKCLRAEYVYVALLSNWKKLIVNKTEHDKNTINTVPVNQHFPSKLPPGIFAYTEESVLEGNGGFIALLSLLLSSTRAKQMCVQWYRYSMVISPNSHTSIREWSAPREKKKG